MNKADLAIAWERLSKIYSQMPKADADILAEWLPVLRGFDPDELALAVSEYIANEKYKPTPADLKNYCFKARATRHKQRQEALAGEPTSICPYCENRRWFKAKDFRYTGNPSHPWEDEFLPCGCRDWTGIKGNYGPIRECLTDALNDPGWVFDQKERAFVRRKGWIDDMPPDTTPVNKAEYAKLMGKAASMFSDF